MRRAGPGVLLVLLAAGCGGAKHGPTRLDYHGLGSTPLTRVIAQDEIRAIDRPRFDRPRSVRGLLRDEDLVVGALLDGRSHAYPLGLLSFHEVVNDGPLAVTWCPLCSTALAFDRDVRGRRLTFGVSGLLLHANQVLYDRESGSLWSQLAERAISGRYRGTRLRPVPLAQVTWGEWLHSHPDTLVLSLRRDRYAKRFTHPYTYTYFDERGEELSSDPYLGYEQKVNVYYGYPLGGLRGSTLVLGVHIGGVAKAYPLYRLRGPISDVVAGHRLRIVPDGNALSAAVYEHGRRLPATPAYWFAWHAFHPRALIYRRRRARAETANLRGTVGPGFTITLKTPEGKVVKTLKSGRYAIRVRDRSPIHNFHLFGPGVGKKTSVQNTGSVTWNVRLRRGLYRYRCDPHRTIMHGRFTVV